MCSLYDGAPRRILLLGDYSNCHRSLAAGLRRLGCDVTVASNGSFWMDCERDVDISRRHEGKLGGLTHAVKMLSLLRGPLSGFDVVAVNDPVFTQLRPRRLRKLFDELKARNRSVFYTAMSTDLAFLDMLEASDSPLTYSEWFVDGRPSRMFEADPEEWERWHNPELADYENFVFDNIDGAVSILYEYHLGMKRRLGAGRAAYAGIPIEIEQFEPVTVPEKIDKVKIFLGRDRNRKLMKGSDYLEEAARIVVDRHPRRAELEIVENVPYKEFVGRMRGSHVVLDQIYSYTPATTALMAMASGLNVVSGAEPEYYDFIGETENRPIINAPTEVAPLAEAIERIVLEPETIRERGIRSREFVKKHNDSVVVARRFLDFWTNKLRDHAHA